MRAGVSFLTIDGRNALEVVTSRRRSTEVGPRSTERRRGLIGPRHAPWEMFLPETKMIDWVVDSTTPSARSENEPIRVHASYFTVAILRDNDEDGFNPRHCSLVITRILQDGLR